MQVGETCWTIPRLKQQQQQCVWGGLITASCGKIINFVWLHLSYPSFLLTVQKCKQIIMINTNLLVLISLDRVLWGTETLLLLRLDNAVFAQRLRYTWETLNCIWIIYLALADFPQLCQENSGPQSNERWPNGDLRRLKHLEWVHHHQVITGAPEGTWTSEDLKSCSWDCTSE